MDNPSKSDTRTRGDLSQLLYHDVREPLRALSNFAFLLYCKADQSSDCDMRLYCRHIERSVAQLNIRFSQLLAVLNETQVDEGNSISH